MSAKNVARFYEKVEEDSALQDILRTLDNKATKNLEPVMLELIEIAKEAGFEFTTEDLMAARNQPKPKPEEAPSTETRLCDWVWTYAPPPPDPPCAHGAYANDGCGEGSLNLICSQPPS
ncbi:MAG: Nif11-like leader peptide family natural product precursor [Candidatus Sedimenticola sp. (ex Thyasira tokunagai)]